MQALPAQNCPEGSFEAKLPSDSEGYAFPNFMEYSKVTAKGAPVVFDHGCLHRACCNGIGKETLTKISRDEDTLSGIFAGQVATGPPIFDIVNGFLDRCRGALRS